MKLICPLRKYHAINSIDVEGGGPILKYNVHSSSFEYVANCVFFVFE
jgi:hypothetical protein